jgi:hypothetical protein
MVEYPELRGLVVSAEELMAYIFDHHSHGPSPDYWPHVPSLPLERWLRNNARPEGRHA